MPDKIRFSIVGFGNIGRRHAAQILQNNDTELIAVCDINPSVNNYVPDGVPFYTSIGEMLALVNADILCVCTPNYLHEAHTIAGLNAGMHTVVEKPMAISVPECDRM